MKRFANCVTLAEMGEEEEKQGQHKEQGTHSQSIPGTPDTRHIANDSHFQIAGRNRGHELDRQEEY